MSETLENMSLAKRQMLVGRARQMFDAGYNVEAIRNALGLSESQVRSIKSTIDEAKKNS